VSREGREEWNLFLDPTRRSHSFVTATPADGLNPFRIQKANSGRDVCHNLQNVFDYSVVLNGVGKAARDSKIPF
jgi:hypothetical protein